MLTDPDTYDAIALLVALSGVNVPADAPPGGLLLRSEHIGHKFGFNDGDAPDAVVDMAEAYYGDYHYLGSTVWHPVLMRLVQAHLLPALGNPDLDLYLLDTNHNPIRVGTPLPGDFPHAEVHVHWLDVLTMVVMHMDDATATG